VALPGDISTVTVSGKFLTLDGNPASGTVTFTTSQAVVDGTGDAILPKQSITKTLDNTGSFSVALPATDDSDLAPTGFTYKVTEQLTTPKSSRSYSISLPASPSTVNLADVAPVQDVATVSSYVLKAGDTMTGALTVPTVQGSTSSGGNLAVKSTSHATKGKVTIDSDLEFTGTGKGLKLKEATNGRMGTATLSAGTVTVANSSVTANTRVMLSIQSLGTVTAPKASAVTARSNGTSFTITSADATDTSVVAWMLVEPSA
jgi:hypothetical protein